MDEGTTLAVGWKISCSHIFETFNDSLRSISRASNRMYWLRTVLPEPFRPTINVKGVWNSIISFFVLSNDRTLDIVSTYSFHS